ncbi:MAG: hypothetical protein IKC58_01410 [Clostridia bacterium]|nr:hypothetical protein [Clostridia bacterium]
MKSATLSTHQSSSAMVAVATKTHKMFSPLEHLLEEQQTGKTIVSENKLYAVVERGLMVVSLGGTC